MGTERIGTWTPSSLPNPNSDRRPNAYFPRRSNLSHQMPPTTPPNADFEVLNNSPKQPPSLPNGFPQTLLFHLLRKQPPIQGFRSSLPAAHSRLEWRFLVASRPLFRQRWNPFESIRLLHPFESSTIQGRSTRWRLTQDSRLSPEDAMVLLPKLWFVEMRWIRRRWNLLLLRCSRHPPPTVSHIYIFLISFLQFEFCSGLFLFRVIFSFSALHLCAERVFTIN